MLDFNGDDLQSLILTRTGEEKHRRFLLLSLTTNPLMLNTAGEQYLYPRFLVLDHLAE
jgi:hypothetical protein